MNTIRILAVVATLCATNQQLRAMDRWSYCVVDSGDMKYVSKVFRQDFGQGYSGDPEVYGRGW